MPSIKYLGQIIKKNDRKPDPKKNKDYKLYTGPYRRSHLAIISRNGKLLRTQNTRTKSFIH